MLFTRICTILLLQTPLKLQSVTPRGSSSSTGCFHFQSKNCPRLFSAFRLLGVCTTRESLVINSHSLMDCQAPCIHCPSSSQTSSLTTDVYKLIQSERKKKKSEHLAPGKELFISQLMFYRDRTFSLLTHQQFTRMAVPCGMKMRMHRGFQNEI